MRFKALEFSPWTTTPGFLPIFLKRRNYVSIFNINNYCGSCSRSYSSCNWCIRVSRDRHPGFYIYCMAYYKDL